MKLRPHPTKFQLQSFLTSLLMVMVLTCSSAFADQAPKVVIISLDGATPRLIRAYQLLGLLPDDEGFGRLRRTGTIAQQNFTVTPSLTAVAHIALATGSNPAANDINSNTFHLVASPFTRTISGFGAPIGGYMFNPLGESPNPTARPLWHALRAAGKSVVTATWAGGDGVDVKVPGLQDSPIIQPSPLRTVDYTVPFGEFGGVSAQGFALTSSDFAPSSNLTLTRQLQAAGHPSFSPILLKKTPLTTFTAGGVNYIIQVIAIDTTDDGARNYDTLVFFDTAHGIQPGPFNLPSTGPAYVKASDKKSSPFYLEGSSNKAGMGFYVSTLTPDLSTVHIGQYAADDIPRTPAVLDVVDDINTHVGFWADQADFRIPERLSSGFTAFSDQELEAMFEDQVRVFVDYQTRVALYSMQQNPNADLTMVYIEQPDGSEHQFLLNDPRQATNPTDPHSIGDNQDFAKVSRYQGYLLNAYLKANEAVERIIQGVGVDENGVPKADVFVVSDHGFDPFFTSVSMNNMLSNAGFDLNKVRAVTSAPDVNLYINLQGREPDGTVTPQEYITLQQQLVQLLNSQSDTNQIYTQGQPSVPLFEIVRARPAQLGDPNFGLETDDFIGQDAGDVVGVMTSGYNFDGVQSPVVQRLGDAPSSTPVLSVSNFYGAHGYNSQLRHMSAIFYAAGPDIEHGTIDQVHSIDVAPTIEHLLGVQPDDTVQGQLIPGLLK
jgi:predicted AlkP superfamily pyrophosphatase or phosphodiesterase